MNPDLNESISSYRSLHLLPVTLKLTWNKKERKKDASNFRCSYSSIVDEASWGLHEDLIRDCSDKNALALLCGRTGPNSIVMVDIDLPKLNESKAVANGLDVWKRLTKDHGEPITWTAETQSGGLHYYFKADSPGLERKSDATKLYINCTQTTIDFRGNGICFAPPTTIIRDGEEHSYRWLKSPWDTKLGPAFRSGS